jgi:hypothetical protein
LRASWNTSLVLCLLRTSRSLGTASTMWSWNLINAACSPEMTRFSSLRGSAMIADPSALRGTSSKSPPLSIRSFARSPDW